MKPEEFYYLPADQLADYVKVFHDNILAIISETESDFMMLVIYQGTQSPKLSEAHLIFMNCALKAEKHLKKEALTVLPFAKRYAKAIRNNTLKAGIQSACPSIQKMYEEHKTEKIPFKLILNILDKEKIPPDLQALLDKISKNLVELENRWLSLTRLENDILFPKIIELESILYPI